jgi:hypothetical protein
MFRTLWLGRYPLVGAFWGFYVLGFVISTAMAGALAGLLIMFRLREFGFLSAALFYMAYMSVATVGVWRSANSYPYTRWWPAMAKAAVLFFTLPFIMVAVRMVNPTFQIGW